MPFGDHLSRALSRLGAVASGEKGSRTIEKSPLEFSRSDSPSASSVKRIFSGNRTGGLRVLHTPSEHDVDIVFLHGLTGCPEMTFFDTNTEIYWPVDLLPQDIPNARILSFGYDTDVAKFLGPIGQNTLEDHASDLVNDLSRIRGYGVPESQRIIIVAHSLGGLVAKKAMTLSENSADEHLMQIEKHTVGFVFMGTPHRGSDITPFAQTVANIVKALGKRVNTEILEALERDSQILAGVENSFANWVRKNEKRVRLACFCEELEVCGVGRVVKRESAKIAGWPQLSIHANHMDMVRFSCSDDEGYQRVSGELKKWTRSLEARADNCPSFEGPTENAESVQNMFIDKLGLQRNALLRVSEPPYQDILPTNASLDWFIKSPEFRAWKDKESLALLWHHGGPGQGKTVIMSYLWEHLPQYFGYSSDFAVIFLSTEYNSSDYSLVASLVFQLMRHSDRTRAAFSKSNPFRDPMSGGDMNKLMWQLLEKMITEVSTRETIFLIDGIDVLKPDMRSSFLASLRCLEKQAQSHVTFRVLISSRPYPELQEFLSHYEGIERGKERNGMNFDARTVKCLLTTKTECLRTLFFREWNAQETRIENTYGGSWLSSNEEYQRWKTNPGSDLLWIEGKPGSGKSTLSKQIFRELNIGHGIYNPEASLGETRETLHDNGLRNASNRSSICASFYYSFRGGITETSHELMLRSIIYQIWSQNESLFLVLRDLYRGLRKNNNNLEKDPMWRYDDLKSALQTLHQIDIPLSTFIIVDGLDESDNEKRRDLLQFLHRLSATTSNCTVKILVASRPETEINAHLMGARHILLQDENIEDIRKTVDRGINGLACLCSKRELGEGQSLPSQYLSPNDFSGIKDYIIDNSQGVFLWVSLVLKDLERHVRKGAFSMKSLEKRARKLPKDLGGTNGFYRTIVDSLIRRHEENEDQDEEEREERLIQGLRILTWVTFPKRPISISELEDVLATPTKLDDVVLQDYDFEQNKPRQLERGILSYCGTLVELHPFTQIVQLIHQTVREFLLDRKGLASPYNLHQLGGDKEIATTCYRHLRIAFMSEILQMDADRAYSQADILIEHLANFNLLHYSFPNITAHLEHLGSSGEYIRQEFESFFKDLKSKPNSYASLLLSKWVKSLTWVSTPGPISDDGDATRCMQTVFVRAAGACKLQVMEILIALQADLNTPDIRGTSALENATSCDQPLSVHLLLNKGADINTQCVDSGNALQAASSLGYDALVRLLLNKGADVNKQGGTFGSALQAASSQGHDTVVKILLDAGADASLLRP